MPARSIIIIHDGVCRCMERVVAFEMEFHRYERGLLQLITRRAIRVVGSIETVVDDMIFSLNIMKRDYGRGFRIFGLKFELDIQLFWSPKLAKDEAGRASIKRRQLKIIPSFLNIHLRNSTRHQPFLDLNLAHQIKGLFSNYLGTRTIRCEAVMSR